MSIKKRSYSPSDRNIISEHPLRLNKNASSINYKRFNFKRMKTMGGPSEIKRQKYSGLNRATTAQSGGFMTNHRILSAQN